MACSENELGGGGVLVRNVGGAVVRRERSIVSCALNHSNNQRLQSEICHHGSSTHTHTHKHQSIGEAEGSARGAVRGGARSEYYSAVFLIRHALQKICFGFNKDHHNAAATSISQHLAHNWQSAVALNKPCGP